MREWIFVASILTLGTIAGMLAMRHFENDADEAVPAVLVR